MMMRKSVSLLALLTLLGTLALTACAAKGGPTLMYFRSGT